MAAVTTAVYNYGPSIPLGEGWTYGGLTSPGSTQDISSTPSTSSTSTATSARTTSPSSSATLSSSRSALASSPISTLSQSSFETSTTSPPTSSSVAAAPSDILSLGDHHSGLSKLSTILLSVLLPVAFLAGIGLSLFAIRRRKRRNGATSAAVAGHGDDGSVQRLRSTAEGTVDALRGKRFMGLATLPFWKRNSKKHSKRQSNRIIGARYGPISTVNSGNRASRVGDRAMLADEVVEMPRSEDGYEPVRLGVRGQEDWAEDAEEYLHDWDDGDSARQQAYPGRGGIQHLSRGGFEVEDDIVDSYMARTPMTRDDPAFSPTSPESQGPHTSPSTGTDHSSPLAQGTSTGKTTGAKWVTGLGIGLGVPKDRSLVHSQMRRRTPRSLAAQEGRNEDAQELHQPQRPPLDNRSSGTESATSGRGWNWLNGLGIAHVFSGTTRDASSGSGEAGHEWIGQSRIPSTNIWGDRDMPATRNAPTLGTDEIMLDPRSECPPQESRTGTMRLVQPTAGFDNPYDAQSEQDYGSPLPHQVLRSAEGDNTADEPSSPRSFIAPLPQHGTMSSFSSHPVNSNHRRRSDSLGSDDSFDRDESRESTGFRHAVLAALGFSSSHSRPVSGSASMLPSAGQIRESGDVGASPTRNDDEAAQGSRMSLQATELFSLPPTGARSSESSQPIGLGLNYTGTRTESHLSHPSHTTWDALYREHSADLELDADMLDFSSPSHMSNSRSGSVSVFASATPASANRSPAMMSTGPMPHSEQFHTETDEPVPAIPSDKLDETGWSREEQREIALFADFSSPDSAGSGLPDGSRPSDSQKQSNPVSSAPESTASFPLPPQRQIATLPCGLRPRPSDNALRRSAETSSARQGETSRRPEGLPVPPFSSEQLGIRRQQAEKSITTPAAGGGPSIFSPTSIFSTDTFGGAIPGQQHMAQGSVSPEESVRSTPRVSGETNGRQSLSRFSYLLAEDNRRSSAISSTEPLSGNTFSSFRQQQRRTSKNSFNDESVNAEDPARVNLRPISESNSELNSRWSMASYPGQPIVPTEVYQQAVSGHASPPALSPSLRETASSRPLPIAVPIATRSPIDIHGEHGFEPDTQHAESGPSDLFMRDASGAANANFDVRLAPPASSKAASFLTARSQSDSARSQTDSAPQDSPLDTEQPEHSRPRSSDGINHEGQLPAFSDLGSASGSGRRSKFSNSTSSSAFALQPLDEQFEDGIEFDDVEGEQSGLVRSHSQAVLLRRSMPQLMSSRQALSDRFSRKGHGEDV